MYGDSSAVVVSERPPTPDEKRAVSVLTHKLKNIRHPSMARTPRPSERPPGRLVIREAIRAQQQHQRGERITAKPFVTERIGRAPNTKLTVGIMCDVSGSMSAAMEPLAVTRWVLAEALCAVQGEVATVVYGNAAWGVQRPRELQPLIQVFAANGSFEHYIQGFSMLDYALNLIDGEGARMLVCITDGHYQTNHAEYAEMMMDACRASGVAVLWVHLDGFARGDAYGHGKLVKIGGMSAVEVAEELGTEVCAEFDRVIRENRKLVLH